MPTSIPHTSSLDGTLWLSLARQDEVFDDVLAARELRPGPSSIHAAIRVAWRLAMWMFFLVLVAAIVVGALIIKDPVKTSRRVFQFVVLGCILLFIGWAMSNRPDVAPELATVQGQR
jgi:hypothetical protein